MVPPGTPYTVLVVFNDPATRSLLHESNILKGWPLKPLLDLNQLQEAKKQAALGMLPFLENGAGAETPVGAGASTTHGLAATNVPPPKPSQKLGAIPRQWARPRVPQPVGSAPTMTPTMQQHHLSTMTSNITPIQAIKPFIQNPLPQAQSNRQGRGRGEGGRGRGRH